MKINLNIEAESASELQQAVKELAATYGGDCTAMTTRPTTGQQAIIDNAEATALYPTTGNVEHDLSQGPTARTAQIEVVKSKRGKKAKDEAPSGPVATTGFGASPVNTAPAANFNGGFLAESGNPPFGTQNVQSVPTGFNTGHATQSTPVQTSTPVSVPQVNAFAPPSVIAAAPAQPITTSDNTYSQSEFVTNFPKIIMHLVNVGKITQETLQQACTHYQVPMIYQIGQDATKLNDFYTNLVNMNIIVKKGDY